MAVFCVFFSWVADRNGSGIRKAPEVYQPRLSAADISRIDTDLVCPVFHGSNSQTIIKMDICHQRDADFLFDFADGSSSLPYRLSEMILQK